jgi:hypothetical protein
MRGLARGCLPEGLRLVSRKLDGNVAPVLRSVTFEVADFRSGALAEGNFHRALDFASIRFRIR